MEVFQGKSIFKGVAIGPLLYYGKKETTVRREKIEDTEAEVARYKEAREKSVAQLRQLHDDSVKKVGEENAAIFDVHAMLMEDEDFCEAIENAIRTQNVNAEYAVAVAGGKLFQNVCGDGGRVLQGPFRGYEGHLRAPDPGSYRRGRNAQLRGAVYHHRGRPDAQRDGPAG